MSGVIDTNILVYAANSESEEHDAARAFLLRAGSSTDPWYLTEGILYEFLRVTTHAAVFPRPLTSAEALSFVRPLIESRAFRILGAGTGHWVTLEDVLSTLRYPQGNLFFDIRTVALMREHGIRRIYTRDEDLRRFPGIEVVDPLVA